MDVEHLRVLSPSYLELDDFLRGQTQVHAVTALELEGALVELGDGLVHVQHGILLAHLPDDLRGGGTCSAWGWRAPCPEGGCAPVRRKQRDKAYVALCEPLGLREQESGFGPQIVPVAQVRTARALWGWRLTRGGRVMPVAVQMSCTTEP